MKNIKGYSQALTESQEAEELNSSLLYNTRMDRPDLVRDLLQKGANPDATDGYGTTAIGWAAHKGHTGILRQLIDAGADANLPTAPAPRSGITTALCSAISGEAGPGETLKMVEILLRAGADPNATDSFQRSPLDLATALDVGINSIVALLDAGADANITDGRGRAPLYWAIKWDQPDVARLLILHGADPFLVFKTVEDLHSFFDGDLSWAPAHMQQKWKRMQRGKSAFGM